MNKECKVIMISTNDNYSGLNIDTHNKNKLSIESKEYCCKKPQHLYITSDEEIKENDWMYSKMDGYPTQWEDLIN